MCSSYYISYYLEHTTPLFEQLDILSFKKLVVQRISLLMFKRHTGITPLPMNNLFTVNNAQHDYYTRQIDRLSTYTWATLVYAKYMYNYVYIGDIYVCIYVYI